MTIKISNVDTGVQTNHDQQVQKQITPAVPTIVITPPEYEQPEQDNKAVV